MYRIWQSLILYLFSETVSHEMKVNFNTSETYFCRIPNWESQKFLNCFKFNLKKHWKEMECGLHDKNAQVKVPGVTILFAVSYPRLFLHLKKYKLGFYLSIEETVYLWKTWKSMAKHNITWNLFIWTLIVKRTDVYFTVLQNVTTVPILQIKQFFCLL